MKIKYEEGMHLTCNICGYKQSDKSTVKNCMALEKEEGQDPHDITYLCGACMDTYDLDVIDGKIIEY